MDPDRSSNLMEGREGDCNTSASNPKESELSKFHEETAKCSDVGDIKNKSDTDNEDKAKLTEIDKKGYIDKYYKRKRDYDDVSQTSENPNMRKLQFGSHHSLASERAEKKEMAKSPQKVYSRTVPILATTKKQQQIFPLKKKPPVLIRNICKVTEKTGKFDDDTDSEIEIRDGSNVRITGNSQKKTICISEDSLEATYSKSRISFTKSQEKHFDGSSVSILDASRSSQNEKITKQNSLLCRASVSQASPYNTRFAHMKLGTIFPSGDRSGVKRKFSNEIAHSYCENSETNDDSSVGMEKSEIEEYEVNSRVCFLCRIAFADEMGVTLNVKKPLPVSKIDFVTLLESFGISCSIQEKENLAYVHICNVCHTLVLDGDAIYKQLLSVASEMKEQWPVRATKKDPVFSLKIPDRIVSPIYNSENSSKSNLPPEKQISNISLLTRPRGRVGRPPKTQVKVEEETDENWRPTQVKVEPGVRTRRRGRPPKNAMKGTIKRRGRGRPRKIAIKGEISDEEVYTCGLCGESFQEENEWACHFESRHKVQLRWLKHNLQKKLKKLISQRMQQSFLHAEFSEKVCPACGVKLYEKGDYLDHLRSFHNVLIDEEYIKALHDYSQGNYNVNDVSASETEREDVSNDAVVKVKKEIISPEVMEKVAYSCKVCNLVVDSEKALKEHTDTSHFSLVVIANDKVNEIDNQVSNSSKVTEMENDKDSGQKCEDCKEVFENQHKFLEHRLNIHGQNEDDQEKGLVRYECEVCGRRIYGIAALRVHMSKVHYKTQSSFKHCCSMCIYKSQSRSQLVKHMKNKHGREIMPSVQCETCGKMYGPSYITKHIATMHSTNPRNFQCNFCDMKFYDLAGLKFHIYHEHANKVWKCNKCPLEFKKYHQLRQHRIFSHSTQTHTCPDCGKTFKRKGDLTEHSKRLHSQRVVLLCPRCPKQYVNRFKLRNHLMKHHDVPWEDTLARNYARHQRANNCRRTEEGVLELNKDQPHTENRSIIIEESYQTFERREIQDNEQFEDHFDEHEYCDPLSQDKEQDYHSQYRQQGRPKALASVKMEAPEEEEYIEIMEATDAFAKDGITYVIIEET